MIYECATCGDRVTGLKAARKHATQGRRTQRDAFADGVLHALALVTDEGAAVVWLVALFPLVAMIVWFIAATAGMIAGLSR